MPESPDGTPENLLDSGLCRNDGEADPVGLSWFVVSVLLMAVGLKDVHDQFPKGGLRGCKSTQLQRKHPLVSLKGGIALHDSTAMSRTLTTNHVSPEVPLSVIPAKAGIQQNCLDPRFRRGGGMNSRRERETDFQTNNNGPFKNE